MNTPTIIAAITCALLTGILIGMVIMARCSIEGGVDREQQ